MREILILFGTLDMVAMGVVMTVYAYFQDYRGMEVFRGMFLTGFGIFLFGKNLPNDDTREK